MLVAIANNYTYYDEVDKQPMKIMNKNFKEFLGFEN